MSTSSTVGVSIYLAFSVVYPAKRNVTNATKVCDLEGVDPGVVALKCIHPSSSPTRTLNELQHLKIVSGQNSVLTLLGGFRARCCFVVRKNFHMELYKILHIYYVCTDGQKSMRRYFRVY